MLIVISIVIVGLLAWLLIASAMKSPQFRLERSAVIKAPPERVHAILSDFHAWRDWSPWEKLDADLKRLYDGPRSGVGAVYAWEGKRAGSGRMEIVEAPVGERVLIKLDFTAPIKQSNMADFALAPADGGTRVNWAMYGAQPFMARVMSNFFNMDKLVGGQFEEGLANLKGLAERG
jgi:hypothetical protein